MRLERLLLLCVLLAALLRLLPQSFGDPMVSLADNGDSYRVRFVFGLKPDPAIPHYASFQRAWTFDGHRSWPPRYVSSELATAGVAVLGSWLASGGFDVRWLAAVRIALLLLAFALLLAASRPLPAWLRIAGAAAVVLVFTDVAYAAYLPSLYLETGSLTSGLLALGTSLRFLQRPTPAWAAASAIAAAAFVGAKYQNAPAGLVLAAAWAAAALLGAAAERRARLAVAAVVALVSVVSLAGSRRALLEDNAYNLVFLEVLPHAADPASVLRDLDLDPSLARYAGTGAWDRHGLEGPAREAFARTATRPRLLLLMARQPHVALDLLRRTLAGSLEIRPRYLGNFEPGRPGLVSERFAAWSRLREALSPQASWLVPLLLLACLAPLALARDGWAAVLAVLALMAIAELLVVALGEGTQELPRHLLPFHVLLDLCALGLALRAACGLTRSAPAR